MLAVNTKAVWYLTRGTGLVSLLLLTATLLLGITQSVRWASRSWPRFIVAGLHKNVSLLVTVFLGLHIATAVLDGFAPIGWIDAVLPFHSPYRPLWLGLGALSFDLLVALILTSLVRGRLGHRAWRAVHWTAYACWPLALVHGLGTGTDASARWALAVSGACFLAVVAALAWRLAHARPEPAGRRTAAALISVAAALAVVVWAAIGPLQRGWAQRAGTPMALLSSNRSAAAATGASTSAATGAAGVSGAAGPPTSASPLGASPRLRAPFNGSLSGSINQTPVAANGTTTVTIDGTLSGGATGILHVVLHGTAAANGGVVMESSDVTLGTATDGQQYQGRIGRLGGSNFSAVVRDAAGRSVDLDVSIAIDDGSRTFTGRIAATAPSEGSGG